MRLFIAINFPAEFKTEIVKARNDLKKAALRGSFTLDENLHLTLVFLGECDFKQTEAIKGVMKDAIFSKFTLTLDKSGYFNRDGGNIWWVSLKDSAPLSNLQMRLSEKLRQRGFLLENRKYTPHITIGRQVKMPAGFVHPEVRNDTFDVTTIELMKSEQINGKLTYTPVFSLEASE